MAPRIVLFGATGYTGELTASAMAGRGLRPLLAGRSRERLERLAQRLGGLDVDVADVGDPRSVHRLLQRGDVLVTTVGPFARLGSAAVEAALDARAHYLDSTGEAVFIRQVFERWGPRAQGRCGLLTAFGYDYVPGNLAGALALREAGSRARRVDVGYFAKGRFGPSGGTRASSAGVVLEKAHSRRAGGIRLERSAARVRSFPVGSRPRQAFSIGSTEAYALSRLHPALEDVDVYLGWFGDLTRAVQAVSLAGAVALAVPGTRTLARRATARLVSGSSGGPDEAARRGTASIAVAIASDGRGRELATVTVEGGNGYDLTADLLAWGAEAVAGGALRGTGALGPADGFGLDELEAGCAAIGLRRTG